MASFGGQNIAAWHWTSIRMVTANRAPTSVPQSPSIELGDILAHLVLPVRPVVAALWAPVVERVANVLLREDAGKMIRGAGIFPLAGARGQVNVTGTELVVNPRIGKILDVVDGIVEIKIIVVQAVHEITEVVNAGHREAALDDVGMLEEGVCGVIRAKRSSHRGDGRL